jgi:hypothetical protein
MRKEEQAALESAFADGFRQARDKQGFLRLAQIPLELEGAGQAGLKLMQVVIEEAFDVGRASPGFGSRELVYHPLPGNLVTTQSQLRFRYVSADELRELTLSEVLGNRATAEPESGRHHHHAANGHDHHHGHDHGHHHGHDEIPSRSQ